MQQQAIETFTPSEIPAKARVRGFTQTPPDSALVTTIDDLTSYFATACRPPVDWLLGVEHEKIAVTADGDPIAYEGPGSVTALLEALQARGYLERREGRNLIGAGRAGEEITLEPGLQVELSAPPLPTAAACERLLQRHLREVSDVAAGMGINFIMGGFQPWAPLDQIPWLPKQRYDVMRVFLPRHGRSGHDMMKRTATVQVNHDFADEMDAAEKLRAAMSVTSIVTALYAASPITEGRPNGYKSCRAAVWLQMDEARCGLIPTAFSPGFGFRSYADWALDVPMFFVSRLGRYHDVDGMTFRRFMRSGWQGQRATMADWALHLSTLFPEVRLKRTIELRGADAGPAPFVAALAALWRGLLDDPGARAAAYALTATASCGERDELRRIVPKAGLAARLGGHSLCDLAQELCAIAAVGLRHLPGGAADRGLLDPLMAYARAGRSPADDLLADFEGEGGDRRRLVRRWRLQP
jgi:glutamate--cysteine ligase